MSRIIVAKLCTRVSGTAFLLRTGLSVVFSLCLGLGLAYGQADVLTHHNDNSRTGLNSKEILLSPSIVNPNQFGKLFSQPVDGIIVGQPLYVRNVSLPDGTKHNVVYVATQHDTVYAFDADNNQGGNAAPLWSVSLANGATSVPISDHGCTGTHYTEIGIMGTPVIDTGKSTMYLVAKTLENGLHVFRLHALDITNGAEKFGGPVVISGSAPSQDGPVVFDPMIHMQRPALLLANGRVYVGFGSNGCDLYQYHGWLFAYDPQSLQSLAVFLATPDGKSGAIWQGGGGPAADTNGNVYVVTANGTFDAFFGGSDYGDSVLKLGWTGGTFGVLDYFTPYNQEYLGDNDVDLGSGGPLLLPNQPGAHRHEMIAGGKEGTLYLIDRDNPGKYNGIDDNDIVQSIPGAVAEEINGVSAYWNSSVYLAGDLDYIKQLPLTGGLLSPTPLTQTDIAFRGAGSASISISANGKTNGIVWAIRHTVPALFAFDATNLSIELYDSNLALHFRDRLGDVARFTTPAVANGKVFVPGKQALVVYGLFPSLSVAGGDGQTGVVGTVLPVSLGVLASDPYTSQALVGVTLSCKDGGASGKFSSSTLTTDSSGMASVSYTLPTKPKAITITCASPDLSPATFSETGIAGPPARINIVSGNNQVAPPNTLLPAPLVVKVADSHGNGVSGIAMSFTDNGAGGVFTAATGTSDSTGNVSTQYTTPGHTGKVKITASSNGVPSKNMTVTVQ